MLQRTMIEWTFSRQVLLRKTCHTFFLCWCNIGLEIFDDWRNTARPAPDRLGSLSFSIRSIALRRIEASADLGINSEVISKGARSIRDD